MTVTEVIQIALDPDGEAIVEIEEGELLTNNDIVCLVYELNKLRKLAEAEYKRGFTEGFEKGEREGYNEGLSEEGE